MKIFSGSNYQKLTNDIIKCLNDSGVPIKLGSLQIDKFSDGEILPCFRESIREQKIFFVSSTDTPEDTIEVELVIDAAKRAGCKSFTLIAPYMGYSRQDKTDHLRSSIGAKVMAVKLEALGLNRLITIDLHASSIQGFYQIPVVHLNGNKVFIDYIRTLKLENLCIVAPDQGAVKRASDFCKAFPDATFAMINKKRIKPNEVHSMELVGDVAGKNVIIVDDMSDTMGTLRKAADLLIQKGALSARAVATHGVLSGKAIENITDSELVEAMVSDSISSAYSKSTQSPKLNVVSCAKLIANTIMAISNKKSVNEEVNEVK